MTEPRTSPTAQQDQPWTWKAEIDPRPVAVETDGREPQSAREERLRGLTQLPDC